MRTGEGTTHDKPNRLARLRQRWQDACDAFECCRVISRRALRAGAAAKRHQQKGTVGAVSFAGSARQQARC